MVRRKREMRKVLLLDRLDRLGTNLLVLDLRCIPTAPERLDQVHRQDHLLTKELGRKALVIQERGLCGDHVQVAGDATDIPVIGELQRPSRVGYGCVLRGAGLTQGTETRKTVLDLLKRSQNGFAVIGDGFVISRLGGG